MRTKSTTGAAGVVLAIQGAALPAAVRRGIAARGLRTGTARAGDAEVVVWHSRGGEPPRRAPDAAFLWLAGRKPELSAARAAIALGAYDIVSGSSPAALDALCTRARELAQDGPAALPQTDGLIAHSAAARSMLAAVARAARTSMPVLITGETGTGKEEAARLIHAWSERARGPYLPINCAAIPNELMESELFGHARGAFSGAVADVDGRLIAADGGSVFLDEIHDTPMSTQVKLLRVLENGEVTRLGESQGRKVDFRIVAATNRNLHELIASGAFGLDLYERLAIVRISLPPLRERREDIPKLAEYFIGSYFERERKPRSVHALSELALEALLEYGWPGNVRELRNVVFSALVNKRCGDTLLLSDLPRLESPLAGREAGAGDGARDAGAEVERMRERMRRGAYNLRAEIESMERAALQAALLEAGQSPTRAARLLGEVGRGNARDPGGTVRAMMRRLGVGASRERSTRGA